jgi:isocitrate dehydrogenase
MAKNTSKIDSGDIINILSSFKDGGFDVVKTENLYNFDGEKGYSLGQGQ